MNGYLLDTSVALLALARSVSLPAAVKEAIQQGPNTLSVVSYWEITLKSMKGTLRVGDPRIWWENALQQLAARPLPLWPTHIDRVGDLPPIHHDPFDRVLIGQAMAEELTLVTTDAVIPEYVSERLRVLR